MAGLRERLQDTLKDAMKARDRVAMSALRTVLGVIDNAEAVDTAAAPPAQSGRIAGGVAGLGAGEVARRELSEAELAMVVADETARWRTLAAEFEAAGQADEAEHLRAQAAIVERVAEAS